MQTLKMVGQPRQAKIQMGLLSLLVQHHNNQLNNPNNLAQAEAHRVHVGPPNKHFIIKESK